MNAPAVLGAALALGVGGAHSYLGERYILIRLFRRPDLPPLFGSDVFTRRTLRFAWHVTTLAWWGLGLALLLLGQGAPGSAVGIVIAATFAATALTILIGSRAHHWAWVVFTIMAVAAWYGTRG